MSSTWTRKVAAPIAAAAAASLLALGASSADASSGTLSVHAARHLAQRLERKQREERSLRFQELGSADRRSPQEIDFAYRDRSTSDVLCSATIVVVQSGSQRHADLTGARCHGIPSEILLYEDVTRHMRQGAKKRAQAVRASTAAYARSLGACDGLVVPRNRRDDVDALFSTGATRAFYTPLRSVLNDFDTGLHDVKGEDPNVRRGVDAWDRTLVLLDELPDSTKDPCAAVRKWSRDGWTDSTAPANFSELKVIRHQFRVQERVLDQVAGYLDDQGVVRKVARAFAPRGLRALTGAD